MTIKDRNRDLAKRYIRCARTNHWSLESRMFMVSHASDLEYALRENGHRTGDLQRSIASARRLLGV